jgi:predicted HTH transcriptional regulator
VPQLTDSDILARLTNVEDATVERKTAKDYRDCVKTIVAFSNSLPIEEPGLIFIGVYDDGRIEDGTNCESLQKKLSGEISNIYPLFILKFS